MIFIMPGNSLVGQLTIDELLGLGIEKTSIAAGVRNPHEHATLPVEVRHADYSRLQSLESAFVGVKTLILIPTKTAPAPRCVEHANALAAANACGVERVIFLSILAASEESVFAIAPFILFAENATRNSGMEWSILRMGLYMEPVKDWVPELMKLKKLPYPVRHGAAAYVTRMDVARSLAVAATAADSIGKTYTIAAPKTVTMPELAAAISQGAGQSIPFECCSDEEFLRICFGDDVSPFLANVLLSIYKAIEAGEFDHANNDVELLTGRAAETVQSYFSRVLSKQGSVLEYQVTDGSA